MRLCLITTILLMVPNFSFGQSLEITAKIGGFTVVSRENSFSQEPSEYSIKSTQPDRLSEAIGFLTEARKERDTEIKFSVDRIVQAVVVRQPCCPPPSLCASPCTCHPCQPGPIPACIRVKCWINLEHTAFIDCYSRRWYWCPRTYVWVNP